MPDGSGSKQRMPNTNSLGPASTWTVVRPVGASPWRGSIITRFSMAGAAVQAASSRIPSSFRAGASAPALSEGGASAAAAASAIATTSNACLTSCFKCGRRPPLLDHDLEVVEADDRVRLGPEAHLACLSERRILDVVEPAAVQRHREARALDVDRERAPRSGRHLDLLPVRAALAHQRQVAALAVLHLVQHHVVLEGVRANHVVVVLVAVAPHETRALI